MKYRIKRVLEANYKPTDGEPFAVTWGDQGWVIWCRTVIVTRKPKKAVKGKGR